MDESSWTLRVALLLIGLVVLGGVYLLAQWRRRREANRRYGRLRDGRSGRRGDFEREDAEDEDLERPLPEDDFEIVVLKPREKVPELPSVTHRTDPAPNAAPGLASPAAEDGEVPAGPQAAPEPAAGRPEPVMRPGPEPEADTKPQPMTKSRRRRHNQLSLHFGDDEEPTPPPAPVRPPPPPPEVLALYVLPRNEGLFTGPDLQRAFEGVGLVYGEMSIYHHFGAGDLRTEKALFSVANMLEPGHFDLATMDGFTTQGVALFIQFPAALDGSVAFEMFLNVAQRLAEALQADLRSEPRKPLDSLAIERLRRIAARYAPQH